MSTVFKTKLREELDFQDIRVKELAEKIHISQRTIEGYLSARASIPPADVAVAIAKALNVSVEYLVTGKEYGQQESNSGEEGVRHALSTEINALSAESLRLLRDIVRSLIKFDEAKKKT